MGVVKNKLTLFHEVLKNSMSLLLLSGKLYSFKFHSSWFIKLLNSFIIKVNSIQLKLVA